MIFFFNANGDLLNSVLENVYQGSNNANTIYLVAPFPESCSVTVRYQLPDGTITGDFLLTKVEKALSQVQLEDGTALNLWATKIDRVATALSGVVTAQFDIVSSTQTVSPLSVNFPIVKGVAPRKVIDSSNERTIQQILSIVSEVLERPIDKTLTQEGQPADAKAVGEALKDKVDYEKLNEFYTKEETNQALSEKADISFVNASKEELVELINTLRSNKFIVVETLPEPSAETYGKIYLVPIENGEDGNYHDEYITVAKEDGSFVWEYLGSTKVDLSDYAKKEYVAEEIEKALQDIPSGGSSVEIDPTLTQEGKAADAKATGEALGGKLDVAQPTQEYNSVNYLYACKKTVNSDGTIKHNVTTPRVADGVGASTAYAHPIYFTPNAIKPDYPTVPTGVLYTGNPLAPAHAANKKYVDESSALYKRVITFELNELGRVTLFAYTKDNETINLYTASTAEIVSYINKHYSYALGFYVNEDGYSLANEITAMNYMRYDADIEEIEVDMIEGVTTANFFVLSAFSETIEEI